MRYLHLKFRDSGDTCFASLQRHNIEMKIPEEGSGSGKHLVQSACRECEQVLVDKIPAARSSSASLSAFHKLQPTKSGGTNAQNTNSTVAPSSDVKSQERPDAHTKTLVTFDTRVDIAPPVNGGVTGTIPRLAVTARSGADDGAFSPIFALQRNTSIQNLSYCRQIVTKVHGTSW